MRKDLRVGLGIGGVLLVVLLVAMVYKSHNKANNQQARNNPANTNLTPDRADNGDNTGGSDSTSASPGPSGSSADGQTAAPSPGTTGASGTDSAKAKEPDPFDKSGDWDSVLKNGPVPLSAGQVTQTPPSRDGTRFNADLTGAQTGSSRGHPLTPGSLGSGTALEPGPMSGTGRTPPTRPSSPTAGTPHTVAQGETFSTIARTVYGSKKYYYLIERANPGVDPTRLRQGQKISIPPMPTGARTERSGTRAGTTADTARHADSRNEYVVKQGDSLYRISMRLYGNANEVDDLYNANKDRIGPDRERLKLGMPLRLPKAPTSNAR